MFRAGFGRLALAASVVVGSLTFVSVPPASAVPTLEGVLYGGGCGNPLNVRVLSEQGKVVASRTLVRAKRNLALEPHAESNDSKRFIFSTFDCVTKVHSLYVQPLTSKPTARQVLTLPMDWSILDATWDIARDAPAVLVRDPDFNYFIQLLQGSTWETLWTGSVTDTGGIYLDGIDSRTGREFIVWGDNSSSWQTWRLRSWGSLSRELSGPGSMTDVSRMSGSSVSAFMGRDGSWVCDWSATGTITDAIAQGKCATIAGGAAYGGVFTDAPGSFTYWLHLSPPVGSNFMVKVTCVGANFYSCGTPEVSDRRASPLGITSSAMANVYFNSVKQVTKLGASSI